MSHFHAQRLSAEASAKTGSTLHAPRPSCLLCVTAVAILQLALSDTVAFENPVAMFHKGKLKESRELFQKHLDNNPDEPVALYYMGLLTVEPPAARRHFERLLRVKPKHYLADDALFQLAEMDFAGRWGLYKTAREKYLRLLKEYPESERTETTLYRLGVTYRVTAEEDSAAIYLNRLRTEFPDSEARRLLESFSAK